MGENETVRATIALLAPNEETKLEDGTFAITINDGLSVELRTADDKSALHAIAVIGTPDHGGASGPFVGALIANCAVGTSVKHHLACDRNAPPRLLLCQAIRLDGGTPQDFAAAILTFAMTAREYQAKLSYNGVLVSES